MTEATMTDAVHDLINPWTDVAHVAGAYKAIEHEPLLVTLRQTTRSSIGGTTSGATSDASRNMLHLEAFSLQEHISMEVATLHRKHLRDRANPLLGYAVRRLAEQIDALWHVNQITEHDYLAAVRWAQSWRSRIWGLLHKPREKELEFCPACEQSKVVNADGEVQAALVAYYREDESPSAKCRHCGREWVGEGALIVLGRMIGAELDEAALTEMGAL